MKTDSAIFWQCDSCGFDIHNHMADIKAWLDSRLAVMGGGACEHK